MHSSYFGFGIVALLALLVIASGYLNLEKYHHLCDLQKETIVTLHEENIRLTSIQERLRDLLSVNPCAIPDTVDKISLLKVDSTIK